ncbi:MULTISPECIES: hypothetical protein [Xanthocytophaga]|uniref:Uncharacterized protein n=2 Tax=Xanthocytophaga TaxID=3078918 RepID=A0AAE3QTC9_9BACT|nr:MULTISPECIES: hypothetical protein [Xanthocytophaga]MDJ1483095.1 hypothetical protein [Xanthocytophaga flavus]MDJ1503634.1 hypothetical protein [Xanthocytophaga agilis]
MDLKFTLRDILVYVFTGLSFFIFVLPIEFETINCFILEHSSFFSGNEFLTSGLAIGGCYILGYLMQSIDVMKYYFCRKRLGEKANKNLSLNKILWADRISGLLYIETIEVKDYKDTTYQKHREDFWERVTKIQVAEKYSQIDYWYVLKDFTNGLETVSLIMFFWSIRIWSESVTKCICLMGMYALIYIAFYIKSSVLSEQFISAVRVTDKLLSNK